MCLFEGDVLFCGICVICVLCLIVVSLPPGKNPFAVKVNKFKIKKENTRPPFSTAGFPAEIRTEYLPNKYLERYL
jgi:hypothetical protein